MGEGIVEHSNGDLGITAMAEATAEVEPAGATRVPNAFYLGRTFLAVFHCLDAKQNASPLERMFTVGEYTMAFPSKDYQSIRKRKTPLANQRIEMQHKLALAQASPIANCVLRRCLMTARSHGSLSSPPAWRCL